MKQETKYLRQKGLCDKPDNRRRARIDLGIATLKDYETEIKRLEQLFRTCQNRQSEYAQKIMSKIVRYRVIYDNIIEGKNNS